MMRFIDGGLVAVLVMVSLSGCAAKSEVGEVGAPTNVVAAFHEKYPTATIHKVEKEVYEDGTVHYEFEYRDNKDGKNKEIELDAQGNIAH